MSYFNFGYGFENEEAFLFSIIKHMTNEEKQLFFKQYYSSKKDRDLVFILSILFGHLGVDCFYIDEKRKGFLKLILTSLTFTFYFILPIWVTIISLCVLLFFVIKDWISIQTDVDEHNARLAIQIEKFIRKMKAIETQI